jgi:hypothetical protein
VIRVRRAAPLAGYRCAPATRTPGPFPRRWLAVRHDTARARHQQYPGYVAA